MLPRSCMVGVDKMLDGRRSPVRPEHGHQVEPAGMVFLSALVEKSPRRPLDTIPLHVPHGFVEILSRIAGARLDLDEDDGVTIDGDEI